jgi:hypothetical protein
MALNWQNFPAIKDIIFYKSQTLFYATLFCIIFSAFVGWRIKNKSIYTISSLILFSVIFEVLISQKFTGFELRYFYHWVLLIPFALILPFGLLSANIIKSKTYKICLLLISVFVLITASRICFQHIKRLYEPDFVPGYIRNYAMHRITIKEWIDFHFPKMNEVIYWCSEDKPMQDLRVLDPSLTWFSFEAGMRVYMVNCRITSGDSQYIASETECIFGKPYQTADPNPSIPIRHKLNQEIICNAQKISKGLYFSGNKPSIN